MQVTETNRDGLACELKVVVPAADIDASIGKRLKELSTQVRIPGFRPGKIPVDLLRQRYGTSVIGEVLDEAVRTSSEAAVKEKGLRPALEPKVEITSFKEGEDLEFQIKVEEIPEIEPMDFRNLKIEKLVAEVSDEQIEQTLQQVAERNHKAEVIDESRPAETGDVLRIDFVGKKDGEAFQGGTAEDFDIELGSGTFIPGFEDQLIGLEPGAEKVVEVTFPESYPNESLAGQPVQFEVKVKALCKWVNHEVDDELAQAQGLDTVDALRNAIADQFKGEFDQISRSRLKRSLLDLLAENHDFPVPQGVVDVEFNAIWEQLQKEMDDESGGDAANKPTEEELEKLREEYKAIAVRRVRLGFLLSEIGRKNNISVTQEELRQAIVREAMNYRGQERAVIEYYQNNEQARASLQAPLYEDKIVDFILEMAEVSEKAVTPEELMREDDDAEEEAAAAEGGSETDTAQAAETPAETADTSAPQS